MSDKAECPGCGSYTSSIYAVLVGDDTFRDPDGCPNCGLPRSAMLAVMAARKRGADADLIKRCTEAEIRAARAETEVRILTDTIAAVREILEARP